MQQHGEAQAEGEKEEIWEGEGDFPGGPVVETLAFNARGVGSIPALAIMIPPASWPKNRNTKQKNIVTVSIKTSK